MKCPEYMRGGGNYLRTELNRTTSDLWCFSVEILLRVDSVYGHIRV